MNRLKGILIAGTLTGFILIAVIVLEVRRANSAGVQAISPDITGQNQPTVGLTGDEAVQAWQAYSRELENTVRVLQERDAQYRAELDAANTTIIQLQDQINSGNQLAGFRGHEEHEEHEGFEFDD